MLQSHSGPLYHQRRILPGRSRLLRQHPVLTPIVLLCGSILVAIAGLFSDSLFPVLTFIGLSSVPLYLSLACVLGIAGILVSIISIIEQIDRWSLQAAVCFKPKEHSYGNRN
jgi:uncharacterized membrane protein